MRSVSTAWSGSSTVRWSVKACLQDPFPHTRSGRAVRCRSTLSRLWVPTGGLSVSEGETGHGKLLRAGFLRQTQSGIFHLLPLGLRVQSKIEALLDKHMASIGASRLSLSTITSEELWRRSGRFDAASAELFHFADRKHVPMMLSPTHEEEITTLVANTIRSYKDLPLRLYQITRKYRDEMRPRHGLLRSREFVMKDLYSFDTSYESAIMTYGEVAEAYRAFFAEMKIPVFVAEASSGDMGGDHSHEYHMVSAVGEDTVITCDTCNYTANDEVATANPAFAQQRSASPSMDLTGVQVWRGITKDRRTLINVWYPDKTRDRLQNEVNIHAVKKAVPDLDTSINNPVQAWEKAAGDIPHLGERSLQILNVIDMRLRPVFDDLESRLPVVPTFEQDQQSIPQASISTADTEEGCNFLRIMDGDGCPRCGHGRLRVNRALELGHTFYLGSRYTDPLDLSVTLPGAGASTPVAMGCYGIGVSRIFGAIAEHGADDKGLQWPRAIAPFELVIIPTSGTTAEVLEFFDSLTAESSASPRFDAILDDRKETFGWKMQDADLIGYPVTIVLGKAWREKGLCEVQCRSQSLKESVPTTDLHSYLNQLLSRL